MSYHSENISSCLFFPRGWKTKRRCAFLYLFVLIVVFQFGEANAKADFILTCPEDPFLDGHIYSLQCVVDGNSVAAERCSSISSVIWTFVVGTSHRKQASAPYPACNSSWSDDNGRCVSKDPVTNVFVYEMRFQANRATYEGHFLKCASDCLPNSPFADVSLTDEYDTCSPMKFRDPTINLLQAGIAMLCILVVIVVIVCVIRCVIKEGSKNFSPVGIGLCVVGCCLIMTGGIILTTAPSDGSVGEISGLQTGGICLTPIGFVLSLLIYKIICVKHCVQKGNPSTTVADATGNLHDKSVDHGGENTATATASSNHSAAPKQPLQHI